MLSKAEEELDALADGNKDNGASPTALGWTANGSNATNASKLLLTCRSMGAMPLSHPPPLLACQSVVAMQQGKENQQPLVPSVKRKHPSATVPREILAYLLCDNQPYTLYSNKEAR
jgi:hypothetical protein